MGKVNVYADDGSGRIIGTREVNEGVTAVQADGSWADAQGRWHSAGEGGGPPAQAPPGTVLEADTPQGKAEAEARRQQYLAGQPDAATDPDAIDKMLRYFVQERERQVQDQLRSPFSSTFQSPGERQRSFWDVLAKARENPYARNIEAPLTASHRIQNQSKVPPEFLQAAQLAFYKLGGGSLKPEEDASASRFLANFTPEQAQVMAKKFHEASAGSTRGKMATAAAMAVAMMGTAGLGTLFAPGVLGGAAAGGTSALAGGVAQSSITGDWDPKKLAIQTAVGAAAGGAGPALASTGMNPALSGALAGGGSAALQGAASGDFDWIKTLIGAGSGALSGSGEGGNLEPGATSYISRLMPWLKMASGAVTQGLAPSPRPTPPTPIDPRLAAAQEAWKRAHQAATDYQQNRTLIPQSAQPAPSATANRDQALAIIQAQQARLAQQTPTPQPAQEPVSRVGAFSPAPQYGSTPFTHQQSYRPPTGSWQAQPRQARRSPTLSRALFSRG